MTGDRELTYAESIERDHRRDANHDDEPWTRIDWAKGRPADAPSRQEAQADRG